MTSHASEPSFDRAIGEAYRAHARSRGTGEHPAEETWVAFASGLIDEASRLRLADHVVSCASCREVYEVVRELMEGASVDPARPMDAGAPGGPSAWRRYAPTLALAASVIVAAGGAMLYLSRSHDEGAVAETTPAPATAPLPVATPEPARPAYQLALVKPEVQLPVDLVVTTRGVAGVEARAFLEQFGLAITPYREGRFEDAVASLGRLAATHGNVAEVWFYLGVSQLFADRPGDALASFDHPGVADAIGDDLLWQRAVALERLGRAEELDAVLRSLCGREGPFRGQACAAMPSR
ncbi:MAG: tol-pal system YbgF family protein [Vicinamibacterales bacterium]